jgi:signal-transduction protein with cAMP-binding, CBS, and nucleotidyltransferase domain
MNKKKFDRFPIVKNKEIVGVLTVRDVLNYKPEVFPEIKEFAQIREENRKIEKAKQKATRNLGICEECGNEDILYNVNGMMVCEDCKEDLL